jgi:hypothetical protein
MQKPALALWMFIFLGALAAQQNGDPRRAVANYPFFRDY